MSTCGHDGRAGKLPGMAFLASCLLLLVLSFTVGAWYAGRG